MKLAAGVTIVLFVLILCWALITGFRFNTFNLLTSDSSLSVGERMKYLMDMVSFSDLLTLNIFIQIPFIIVFWLFCLKKISLEGIVFAGVFNSLFHVMLFQPFTVVKKDSVTTVETTLSKISLPGYPSPSLSHSLQDNSKEGFQYFDEVGVANLYNKKIGRVDYNITPSNLLTQERFWFNQKAREHFMGYPVFYKADSAVSADRINDVSLAGPKKYVILDNPKIVENINEGIKGEAQVFIEEFSPNKWRFKINAATEGFYCLLQNNYPRWALFIDGVKSEIIQCNMSFMGFKLPAGTHHATLQYEATDIKVAYMISLAAFMSIIAMALLHKRI